MQKQDAMSVIPGPLIQQSVRPSPTLPCFASREWLEYYQRNSVSLMPVPWDVGAEITDDERRAIASSLQGFQLGESSEGRNLARCARSYADRFNDPEYYEAIVLFIKEEQRHARDLGRFMDLNGISTIGTTWPDTVFRFLRRGAGLELSVSVLVTAEIIAQVYYPALRGATDSRVLKAICDQIIQDETPHVQFQCERLAILRAGRVRLFGWLTLAAQRFLFFGTCFVVWQKHHAVFRRTMSGFRDFWVTAWNFYGTAERIMQATIPPRP